MSLRTIYYRLTPSLRFLARKIYYFPIDTLEGITGKREKYIPKRGDIFIGSGDFKVQGIHQLDLLKRYISLQEKDHVLDVGSGIGRTAIPLTKFLHPSARYEGFDVVEKGVRWCNRKINPDFPNFNFTFVPLNNDLDNTSKDQASEFTFPYQENSFHKVFLFSVFTHMKVNEIRHYLSEITRVLKPGGMCLSTFFIYNQDNEQKIVSQQKFSFPVKRNGFRLMHEKVQSANIALDQQTLIKMVEHKPLQINNIVEGYWKENICKTEQNSYQDIVIFEKRS
jgi:ubiquinone/menaquinone biosynthesis C-methylase UbiE